ncbi:MAG: hypothetical protein V8R55_10775, partial [Dysosmobacter sp.]
RPRWLWPTRPSWSAGEKNRVTWTWSLLQHAGVLADPERGLTDVFEKLDGNLELLFRSIRREDSGSGILYFGRPDDYDDIEILTPDDVTALLQGASAGVEELVVDLGSSCDRRPTGSWNWRPRCCW